MKARLIAIAGILLAIMLTCLGLTAATVSPANADITWGKHAAQSADQTVSAKDITWGKRKAAPRWPGAEMSHITDDGFDDPWSVYCYDGRVFSLYEGQWSKNQCPDVYQISVLSGRQVVCWDRTGDRRVYGPGVHYIAGATTYLRCVHQLA